MSDKILAQPASPPMRFARIALVALIVLALAISVAIVGSQLIRPKPAIPQGGAAVFTYASIVSTNAFGGVGGDIYTVQGDGTNLRRLTAGAEIDLLPAFSPDGSRIAFRAFEDGTGNESVVVMDAGGGDRKVLATSRPGTLRLHPVSPAWSPDGSRLLFSTTESCSNPSPCTSCRPMAPRRQRAFSRLGWRARSRAGHPDGKRIAFLGTEGDGKTGVYVADVGASRAGRWRARRCGSARVRREPWSTP